jgi:hypothetical protein
MVRGFVLAGRGGYSPQCGKACIEEKWAYNVGKCGKSGEKWGKVGTIVDNCGKGQG